MSEDFAERLSRFTPDGTDLDRDALLFAAGRASARPNRRWIALCGTLAAAQLLTLGLWWSRPALPPFDRGAPVVKQDQPPPAPVAPRQEPALWQLRDQAVATEGNLPSAGPIEHLAAPEPALHAFGALPETLFN